MDEFNLMVKDLIVIDHELHMIEEISLELVLLLSVLEFVQYEQ